VSTIVVLVWSSWASLCSGGSLSLFEGLRLGVWFCSDDMYIGFWINGDELFGLSRDFRAR
jgi:hypothetical protein